MNNLKNEDLETIETKGRSIKGWRILLALLLVTMVSVVPLSAAAPQPATFTSPLAGKWVATIVGITGCGFGTAYVTFTLNSAGKGKGTVTNVGHTQGCGDSTASGLDFNITSLNANGSGTANLTCGPGCGWDLNIQVARNHQIFNLVDVSPANPGNFIEGTAIKQ